MWPVAALGFFVLGMLASRGSRTAYLAFITLGVSFMPAREGFQFISQPCEVTFSLPLGARSLANYGHIVLFAAFSFMTFAQFRPDDRWRFLKVALAVLTMGLIVELEQAVLVRGHCRARDLIPDFAGYCLAAVIVVVWYRLRRAQQPAPQGDSPGAR